MVFSPALAHRQRKLAQQAAEAAGLRSAEGSAPAMPDEGPVSAEYQALLARQHDDLRSLHQIQSQEARTALKAELIDQYRPWVEGALALEEGASAPQDEIVVTTYLWAVDTRDWAFALRLAAHITAHGLQLPERFHRTPGGFLISEMAKAAIDEPGSVSHEALLAAIHLLYAAGDPPFLLEQTAGPAWDMKDETRARIHRAMAESWSRLADTFDPAQPSLAAGGKPALVDAALAEFTRATTLDPKVGVKKQIEALEREARKLADAAGAGTE